MLLGGGLGVVAGYRGGVIETVIMRIMDMFLAFPALVLALAVAADLGPSEYNEIFAISFLSIPVMSRLARSTVLRLREQDFILSARLVGGTDGRILLRHVVPSVIPPMFTFAVLFIGAAMVIESSLGFLGVGVRPPTPSWGNMIASAQPYLASNSALVFVPGAFLCVTVVCLNLLGDALRSRLELR